MVLLRRFLLLFIPILFLGCSGSQDVVGHGPIQKRKYRSGWHVDLRGRKEVVEKVERTIVTRMEGIRSQVVDQVPGHEVLASTVELPIPGTAPRSGRTAASVTITERTIINGSRSGIRTPTADDPTELRRWNRMALVSGAFLVLAFLVIAVSGGSSLMGYLLTFAFITGVIGLILAIKNKERGKLIAIAAILLPLLIFVAVIAALNSTW